MLAQQARRCVELSGPGAASRLTRLRAFDSNALQVSTWRWKTLSESHFHEPLSRLWYRPPDAPGRWQIDAVGWIEVAASRRRALAWPRRPRSCGQPARIGGAP